MAARKAFRHLDGFDMSKLDDFSVPVQRHKFWFQFVTTPTADTPGTVLLLHFDNKRYLFGRVAEGTQRACVERGVSLKKVRTIFLTGETRWEHNGGLLGMTLTMADIISENLGEDQKVLGDIMIYGGPKIWHTMATARRFIFRTSTPLKVNEANPDRWKLSDQPDYYDENVRVWTLPVRRSRRRNSAPNPELSHTPSQDTLDREQSLRQKTVHDMWESDWRKDRLYESAFKDVNLPAVIWLRDPQSKELKPNYCSAMTDAPHISPDQTVLVRLPWPAALVSELPSAQHLPSSIAMSYFIKGRPQRGIFDSQKAKGLGVKPGKLFGILSNGQEITLDDGTVVTPDQVMNSPLPGYGLAVLDVPDEHYLPDLRTKLIAMKDADILTDVHAFTWILGPGVFHSEVFKDFVAEFNYVKHVISAPETTCNHLTIDSAANSAARLNQIRPETFQVPKFEITRPIRHSESPNIVNAERGLMIEMTPKFSIVNKEIPPPTNLAVAAANMTGKTRALIPQPSPVVVDHPFKDVSIFTLGTGSAVPSKYRNVSSNLLHIPELGYFMFDAGENALGQLNRLFTPAEVEEILCNLHMIWISHLHADHHLGTMSILTARQQAVERRQKDGQNVGHHLYVVSEENMADYLNDYSSIQASNAVLLRCRNSNITDTDHAPVKLESTTLPILKLDSCQVSHCRNAQAVSVTFSNGFKISYSGDCRPSLPFVQIGQDSDVLIHEATFDDGMEGDAVAKKHSTIGEALGVAQAMRAKNVILTHFSQRYQKLPTLAHVPLPGQTKLAAFDETPESADLSQGVQNVGENFSPFKVQPSSTSLPNVEKREALPALRADISLQEAAEQLPICIAFDLMRVTIPQIKDMYKYYPAIESMFDDEQGRSDAIRDANRALNEASIEAKQRQAEKTGKSANSKPPNNSSKKKKQGNTESPSDKAQPKHARDRSRTSTQDSAKNSPSSPSRSDHSSSRDRKFERRGSDSRGSMNQTGHQGNIQLQKNLKRTPSPETRQSQTVKSPKKTKLGEFPD